jgi:peptide/nickel transport system substrate-binding protein
VRVRTLFALSLAFTLFFSLDCQAAQTKQKVLVFGRSADATFLDPAKFLDNESAMVIENIFDGLVRYRDDSTLIEPALATSWNISRDGLVYTFTLRKGVSFHDGTPFNAQAAQFSLLRKIDPAHPFYRPSHGKMDTTLRSVKSVEALGDYSLRITLKQPHATLLDELARHSSYIVSPTAVRALGEDFGQKPVGTGPFAFESWTKGERIVLRANTQYFGGAPKLDSVVFRVVPDGRVRLLELKAGAIQALDALAPDDCDEVRRTPGLALDAKPGMNVGYLAMNGDRPPLDNPKVRLAIAHAVNKPALIKLAYQGMAALAITPLPPTMWSSNAKIKDYEYNPALARKLLKQAGLAGGFETTLWVMPVSRPYMPQPEKIARAIQDSLEAVGIHAKLVTHDWSTYLAKVYAGEHGLALLGWVSTADPSDILEHLFDADNAVKPHASNISFFRDKTVHTLLDQAEIESDPGRRMEAFLKVQQIVHDQAPLLPLAHAHQLLARSAKVRGIVNHQTGVIRFAKADVQ